MVPKGSENGRLLASSWHWHIESLFGADYLRKNHLSQKFAELRYIEIIAGWLRSQIP